MKPQQFIPKEDITAYELALAVVWINIAISYKFNRWHGIEAHKAVSIEFEELPDNVKRHFKEMEQVDNVWRVVGENNDHN